MMMQVLKPWKQVCSRLCDDFYHPYCSSDLNLFYSIFNEIDVASCGILERGSCMNKKSVFRIVITFIVVSALFIAGYFAIDAYTQKVPIMSIRQSKKIGATYMTLNNPFFEIIDEQLQKYSFDRRIYVDVFRSCIGPKDTKRTN